MSLNVEINLNLIIIKFRNGRSRAYNIQMELKLTMFSLRKKVSFSRDNHHKATPFLAPKKTQQLQNEIYIHAYMWNERRFYKYKNNIYAYDVKIIEAFYDQRSCLSFLLFYFFIKEMFIISSCSCWWFILLVYLNIFSGINY